MDPLSATVGTTVVLEGIKFLYSQAGEVLKAWRERRRNADAGAPVVIEPPKEITVSNARPLAEARSLEMEGQLLELKDLAEGVKDGRIDPSSPEARIIAATLRDLMESVLQTPITFSGETPRILRITDVDVTVDSVSAKVAGLRASLDKLKGSTDIRDVKVKTKDVLQGGDVTGVDLT